MTSSSCGVLDLVVATVLLLSLTEAGRPSHCQIWKSDIQRTEEAVKVSRDCHGLWLSEKCEILPGPQFLLRRYQFRLNGKFHLTRYYYSDPWCTSAAFSVTVDGSFYPPPEKATSSSASWVVPGGLEVDYTLQKMILVPFTIKDAMTLSDKINSSCPGSIMTKWKPYKKYKVMNYENNEMRNKVHRLKFGMMDDMDCTSSLGITFNELQLMRKEHRTPLRFMVYHRPVDSSADIPGRSQYYLYLGADGLNPRNRPTYYQVPLLHVQTQFCPVCRMLFNANPASPPQLSRGGTHYLPPAELDGHWISMRCEVRPYGLFLKREFFFSSESRHWTGQHEYFKDPHCRSPMFTLNAEGTFSMGQPSKEIPDALQCDFGILDSSITPEDQQFANNLNGLSNCGSGSSWKIGKTVNLSLSGGCKELGIDVPSTELELLRFDVKKPGVVLLQLGDGTENHRRPTSFQSPLVQCSHEAEGPDDHNLLFNDLRPLPLISGSLSLHNFQNLFCNIVTFVLFITSFTS